VELIKCLACGTMASPPRCGLCGDSVRISESSTLWSQTAPSPVDGGSGERTSAGRRDSDVASPEVSPYVVRATSWRGPPALVMAAVLLLVIGGAVAYIALNGRVGAPGASDSQSGKISTAPTSTVITSGPSAPTTEHLVPVSSIVSAVAPIPTEATTSSSTETRLAHTLARSSVVAKASSALASEPGCGGVCSYDAAKLLDDDPSTAWAEGVDGSGAGQSIEFKFDASYSLSAITILPGWQRSDNPCLFLRNGRPLTVSVVVGQSAPIVLRLDDAPTSQRFPLSGAAASVRVVIETVQSGRSCGGTEPDADTLISGVAFDVVG
jgi:hypothetical protein